MAAALLGLLTACAPDPAAAPGCAPDPAARFTQMACDPATGVAFRNDLHYTDQLNPYTYRNYFNGGGVGLGDFNGDGLLDVYLTGNLVPNKLYLNRGNWRFEDVTEAAGVACPDVWSTGVAVVDIDGDGDQDLYVGKAGPPAGEDIPGMTGVRHNELFLNNGDATFREASAEFGLDVVGLTVHSAFFDYDGDGDLDCYLLNNSTRSTTGYNTKAGLRDIPDPEGGNKLLRNEVTSPPGPLSGGKGETDNAPLSPGPPQEAAKLQGPGVRFTDVTQHAGIYSSAIGFGLGVTVGDVNGDDRPDLFVSNDYFERDYLYLNRGDGTFAERLTDFLPEISKGSMGADLADLTGDGLSELFVTEMLPRSERRRKTKAVFDSWNRYQLYRDQGYHQQFSRNVLQLNRGGGRFSEVGRLAGVAATDWSWGALLCDLDNDGLRDIFVANGVGRDLLDQDYLNFDANPEAVRRMIKEEGKKITDIVDKLPATPLPNAVFNNTGGLDFTDVAAPWGFADSTFSNGAAYGDLDNDGDLDLVVNNIDGLVGLYRNNSPLPGRMIALRATAPHNPDAIGARAIGFGSAGRSVAELYPMRGFQSTVDKRLHFAGALDSVHVTWPDGTAEAFVGPADTLLQGTGLSRKPLAAVAFFGARAQDADNGTNSRAGEAVPFVQRPYKQEATHTEDRFSDFDRNPLLFLGVSNEGPALAFGSHCGGRDDSAVYLGGAAGEAGQLFFARAVSDQLLQLIEEDRAGENVDAVFFDANGDNVDDLYVVNGSNQFAAASSALLDRLYLSDGRCGYYRSEQLLPSKRRFSAGSCVRPYDVDGDGDLDLFVGGRLKPGLYGVPTDSYLLLNDGRGVFTPADVPELKDLGMVTAAEWLPEEGGEPLRLVVACEWGAVKTLSFDASLRVVATDTISPTGLWQSLTLADVNGDGRTDVIAGNHGRNSLLKASGVEPLALHVNDFDGNGQAEQLLVKYDALNNAYPLVLRDDLVKQLPALRKTVTRYADYADSSLGDLFPDDRTARSVVNKVTELASVVLLNTTDGWTTSALPPLAQLSPVYAIAVTDVNDDDLPDLILGGNQTVAKPELGIYAAGFGVVLLNAGAERGFRAYGPEAGGPVLEGDVRAILPYRNKSLLVARSNGPLTVIEPRND